MAPRLASIMLLHNDLQVSLASGMLIQTVTGHVLISEDIQLMVYAHVEQFSGDAAG